MTEESKPIGSNKAVNADDATHTSPVRFARRVLVAAVVIGCIQMRTILAGLRAFERNTIGGSYILALRVAW